VSGHSGPWGAQEREGETAGRLRQGLGGAFCILDCGTKLRCLIRLIKLGAPKSTADKSAAKWLWDEGGSECNKYSPVNKCSHCNKYSGENRQSEEERTHSQTGPQDCGNVTPYSSFGSLPA